MHLAVSLGNLISRRREAGGDPAGTPTVSAAGLAHPPANLQLLLLLLLVVVVVVILLLLVVVVLSYYY